MAIEQRLVGYLKHLRFEDIPPKTVELSKRAILDTLAVIMCGSGADGVDVLVDVVRQWAGRPECIVPVYGVRVPSPLASLASATMARACDFDSVHEGAGIHADATIVPAALAAAQYRHVSTGAVTTGRDLIVARTIGVDLQCRLRLAGGKRTKEYFTSETYAPIPVAAMGAKMLGLDEDRFFNAMGIAYSLCSGNPQGYLEGADTVRLQQGFAAQAGIIALVLADRGLQGVREMLGVTYGLYATYTRGESDLEALTSGLGSEFRGDEVSLKVYPCCKFTHGAIVGAAQLMEVHGIRVEQVREVSITTSSRGYNLCGEPERKLAPQTVTDAQFSFYYIVGATLLNGKVTVADFTREAIHDSSVLKQARKVQVSVDPEKDALPVMVVPVDLTMKTTDGKEFSVRVEGTKGDSKHPLGLDEIEAKVRQCARQAVKPLGGQKVDMLCELVRNLEDVDDVTALLDCLVQ